MLIPRSYRDVEYDVLVTRRADNTVLTPEVTGIVLAAGLSSRWGSGSDKGTAETMAPKQLAHFRGRPLVLRAVRTLALSKATDTVVIIGHHAQRVRAALAGTEVRIVTNPNFRDGQSTSVRLGIRHVDPQHAAAIIVPCDQPLLDAALINALIDAFVASGAPAVVPRAAGRLGAPALVARALFPALENLAGDVGARSVLAALGNQVETVPVHSALPLLDVDTPADLARLATLTGDDTRAYS